jgi:hypothetical protein
MIAKDELDALVSIAIHRAELLDDIRSPLAKGAWREVMEYEERLAAVTSPDSVSGGVARAGAVNAALVCDERQEAVRLAEQYLAEPALSDERRATIRRLLREDEDRLSRRFRGLAATGHLGVPESMRRLSVATAPRVFPMAV